MSIEIILDKLIGEPKLKEINLELGEGHNHPYIRTDGTEYLCLYNGNYMTGRFSTQWYGLSFFGGFLSHQYDKPGTNSSSWQRIFEIVTEKTSILKFVEKPYFLVNGEKIFSDNEKYKYIFSYQEDEDEEIYEGEDYEGNCEIGNFKYGKDYNIFLNNIEIGIINQTIYINSSKVEYEVFLFDKIDQFKDSRFQNCIDFVTKHEIKKILK
jgi:hypothetical protein